MLKGIKNILDTPACGAPPSTFTARRPVRRGANNGPPVVPRRLAEQAARPRRREQGGVRRPRPTPARRPPGRGRGTRAVARGLARAESVIRC